ncbi:MAG: RluA family pseudouridine synthase [Myxococcota bacterium]|nr:RluA family pseudouridine synthase [Myxococcota bacterium]
MDTSYEWQVDEGEGERLDAWIVARLPDTSRSQISRAVSEGRVLVDGEPPPKAGLKLRLGQTVALTLTRSLEDPPEGEDIPLTLVHVDEHLAVVDKPAGLVVHPAPGHRTGTLVNGLVHHLQTLSTGGAPIRPGIVHRLDKDTSGLLVVARTEEVHAGLSEQFQDHSVDRRYLTVVQGTRLDDEGAIETGYGRHPKDRRRMTGRAPEGKRACTHWKVLDRSQACSLLMCRLETGRTHQIRVHLSEAGYPVVADEIYGRKPPKSGSGSVGREFGAIRRMGRQALHAASLGFTHPETGERLWFRGEPPEDFAALVHDLFGSESLHEALDGLQS